MTTISWTRGTNCEPSVVSVRKRSLPSQAYSTYGIRHAESNTGLSLSRMIFAPPELPPDEPPGVVDVQRPVEILAGEGETVVDGELTIQWVAPEKCPDA